MRRSSEVATVPSYPFGVGCPDGPRRASIGALEITVRGALRRLGVARIPPRGAWNALFFTKSARRMSRRSRRAPQSPRRVMKSPRRIMRSPRRTLKSALRVIRRHRRVTKSPLRTIRRAFSAPRRLHRPARGASDGNCTGRRRYESGSSHYGPVSLFCRREASVAPNPPEPALSGPSRIRVELISAGTSPAGGRGRPA
jgi:hypothetical protein